jgi:hypothetical protein
MGHVRVPLRIAKPRDERLAVEVDALVSKARVHVLLPVEVAAALPLSGTGAGEPYARIGAHQGIASITLLDSSEGAVVGSLGLTALGLRLDASDEALVEADNLLLAVN